MKKNIYILSIVIFLLASCSKDIIKEKSDVITVNSDNGKYEYLLSEGLRQKYIGSIADAVTCFEECIKISPEKSTPYFEMSQILSVQGNEKKATEYALKAAENEKDNVWFQVYCGGILAGQGQLDQSLIFLERALKLTPDYIDIKTAVGKVYIEKGEIQKASAYLNDLRRRGLIGEQEMADIVNLLATHNYLKDAEKWSKDLIKINSNEVRYKAMLAEIYKSDRESEKADSIYNAIITENPEDGESQMLVMSYVLEKKEYKDALTFLSAILINDKIDRGKKIDFLNFILKDTAFIKEQTNAIDVNLRILEAQFANDEEVLVMRPEIYKIAGKIDEAIERYFEIIDIAKTNFYSKQQLLILLAQKNRFEELFKIAKSFATDYNTSILGKIYYGLSAMELKKYDIADEEFKKAYILAGNNDELRFNVLSTQSELAFREKDFKEAFRCLDEALKIKPEDISTLNNYAYYLAENNQDLGKALEMISKVIKAEPKNSTYLDTYGWVIFKMGKTRKALNIVGKSLSLSKDKDPELLEHMGFILEKLKKYDRAVLYFKEALARDKSKEYLKTEIEKCTLR